MSKHPIATRQRPEGVRRDKALPVEKIEGEVIEGADARAPFFSFHYSYAEVSSHGGRTRLKSHSARFEDGRLTTEKFDADMDPEVFDRAVGRFQQRLFDPAASLLRAMAWWLPSERRSRGGED